MKGPLLTTAFTFSPPKVDERILTFELHDGIVRDAETGGTRNIEKGLAEEGPLQGQAKRAVPYIPAFQCLGRLFPGEPVVG